jgi:AcrR family transcriptional regulator
VQQTRSRRTLDALLDAAEHLLEQKSYSEISLTELVGAAGVTTGAFYSRFESKNDLLVSLHQRYLVWLRNMVDDQLDPSEWRGLSLRARADLAADLVCRLFETRRGLLRAILLIQNLCDRLDESLAPEERPARDELEFAVYSAITLARESILFPGLPMARALGLDPPRLRARLARLLEFTLSRIGSDRT